MNLQNQLLWFTLFRSSREKFNLSAILGFSFFPEFNFRRLRILGTKYNKNYFQAWKELTAKDLYELRIRANRIPEILAKKNILDISAFLDKLNSLNIKFIDIFSAEYPLLLREIYDPPIVIYKKGDLDLNKFCLAVVGTRTPSDYGLKATEKIVRELKPAGCTIVSGLALGIDTQAHQTALKNELPTIAVLGTGLDRIYPKENYKLFQEIAEKGALISEYIPGIKPEPWNFPRRNRIITGLSKAVLVMEGTLKSGALISGKIGLAQNREVFALPGSIFSEKSIGTNWLLEQGATPLLNTEQIIANLLPGKQLSLNTISKNNIEKIILSPEEKNIYEIIDQSIYLDDLLEKSKINYSSLIKMLTALELKGVITQLPGKKYIKT